MPPLPQQKEHPVPVE